jgi:pseudouridine synthase
VKLQGLLRTRDVKQLTSGVTIEGRLYRAKAVELLKAAQTNAWYRIVVTEGRYHHIRKLGDAVSHPVLKLRRVRIGPIHLGRLKPGHWSRITHYDITRFLSAVAQHAPEPRPTEPRKGGP